MKNLALNLLNDDAGFVISAELVLVSTITVLAMVVGLSEVAYGVVQELEDTGSAIASVNPNTIRTHPTTPIAYCSSCKCI